MEREDGRLHNQLRPVSFDIGYSTWAEGSCLVKFGRTHVLCTVTIEDTLPPWLKNQENPHGWLTAEYAMLPRSTQTRTRREQRWPKGRTQEISRLIGRSLRMALNLELLGERTLTVDCDVLSADGGTRTAAITGGWVALVHGLRPLISNGTLPPEVIRYQIAAISVGMLNGQLLLDLPYTEDAAADVDMNIVMTEAGDIVEIQGTGENEPFSLSNMNALVELASYGIKQLHAMQTDALTRAGA
jgi:ribonuclease PH